jgi:hypothetical protein
MSAPPPESQTAVPMAEAAPRVSLPSSWFRAPLDKAIRKLVRPSVAHTRRKMLTIKMAMPREIFEEFLEPLQEEDGTGLVRTDEGRLIPVNAAKKSSSVNRYVCTINKGSVSDRLFHLNTMDEQVEPIPVSEVGEEGVYEVQAIWGSRPRKGKKGFEYLIKWAGWDATTNTWEASTRIDPKLVAAYHGRPAPRKQQPKRGLGCARVRLSHAEHRRGGTPTTLSMVCGKVVAKLVESRTNAYMPLATLQFFVLSMDKTGHIIWPTDFDAHAKASLRMQARSLLRQMIADPANPADETMEPALQGHGTSAMWVGAPQRKLVVVQPLQA